MPEPFCVYVATALGFTEPGRRYAADVLHPRLAAAGCDVLDPWHDETGVVAATLALPPGAAGRAEALRRMSRAIGERNRRLLGQAAAVLALLDGPDVDAGVAAEVGWAAARRVPVVGWRSDFRLAEHEASRINVQVEDFVLVSGGLMVSTLDEAVAALDGLRRGEAAPAQASSPSPRPAAAGRPQCHRRDDEEAGDGEPAWP